MDRRSIIFVLVLSLTLFGVHYWFSGKEQAAAQQPQVVKTEELKAPTVTSPATPGKDEEKFYVLENAYQQLVFSNIGGALAEINLPFKNTSNAESVVRKIEFDDILQKEYPQTVHFPNQSYFAASDKATSPELLTPKNGGYYPLIRRSIIGAAGRVSVRVQPRYYALNILSQDERQGDRVYKLKQLDKDSIEFELVQSGRKITKRFSFPKDPKAAPYCINLSIKVEGDARGLFLTSGVPEVELMSGSFSPSLKYRQLRNKKSIVEQVDLPKTSLTFSSFYPDWVCDSNGFLGVIMDPLTEIEAGFLAERVPGEIVPTRLITIDVEQNLYPADKYPGYEIEMPLKNSTEEQRFRIFAGPFASTVLKTIDKTFIDPAKHYTPDYLASQSFHGWFAFISEPFAKFLFFLMKMFYSISHSWGISIILLTIALRIMLYPLNAWSIKSTSKMQEIAPQVTALQEKYKKDPKRAQMEIVGLYKAKGVNPFSGCLPLLIQLPFLIGMFDLLKSTFELRGAPFIPHWIDNLTAPDIVFSWHYHIPFLGSDFHLLPILIGLVMYVQQKFSSPLPKDKSLWTDQQKQQKLMGNIMVIVFSVMFYNFPSGLNLYWLFSILLGIFQQWMMTRKKQALQKT
ncbi:MAG: membrane protein insertase YidC [Chlamydiales bacterium]